MLTAPMTVYRIVPVPGVVMQYIQIFMQMRMVMAWDQAQHLVSVMQLYLAVLLQITMIVMIHVSLIIMTVLVNVMVMAGKVIVDA